MNSLMCLSSAYKYTKQTVNFVAAGNSIRTLAYSYDGKAWNDVNNSASNIFTITGRGVAYGNNLWVALGEGTNRLAISTNGTNWTIRSSPFSTRGISAAWNGSIWVAVGQGTNSIAYSYDGTTWTGVTNSTTNFFTRGYGVAWSSSLNRWVAVGEGTTHTIATSSNGTSWTGQGKTVFSTLGRSVAWSSSLNLWVAGGQGTNTIAYSSTALNSASWTAVSNSTSIFSNICYGVGSK